MQTRLNIAIWGPKSSVLAQHIYVFALALANAIAIAMSLYKIHLPLWTSAFLNALLVTALHVACSESQESTTGVVVTSRTLCVLEPMCIRGETDVYI